MSSTIEISKTCEWCGSTFIARKCTTRYCSKRCAEHAYKDAKRKEHVAKEQSKANSPETIESSPFISPTQCARLLGVSRRSIYNYLAANSIPCFQFKGKTLISRESLNTLFDGSHHYQLRPTKEKQPITEFYTTKEVLENSVSAIHGCSRQRKKTTFRKLPNEARHSGVNRTLTDSLPSQPRKKKLPNGTRQQRYRSVMG